MEKYLIDTYSEDMINCYEILGIEDFSNQSTIKKAFRKLALQYHPDKNKGSVEMEEQFKIVNKAYQILSNLNKKQYHDTLLYQSKYDEIEITYKKVNTYRNYTPSSTYGQKKNYLATVYAFVFTFGIALLVTLSFTIYDSYLEKKYQDLLNQRRDVFNLSKNEYRKGALEQSLAHISSLLPFKYEENQIELFYHALVTELKQKVSQNFESQHYDEALYYYTILEKYPISIPLNLTENIAISYRQLNQPTQAIQTYKKLLSLNYQVIQTLVAMSDIYQHDLQQHEKAIQALEIARSLLIEEYIANFGKAYMLVIDADDIPHSHFFVFTKLAELYGIIEDENNAQAITNWINRVWGDNQSSF